MSNHALRALGSFIMLVGCFAVATAPVMSQGPAPKTAQPAAPGKAAPPVAPAPGTLPKETPKEVEIESELDLVKLLQRELVFPSNAVTDSIWQVEPTEGRFIMRLPLKFTKPAAPVSVSGANVKNKGGRFICWQLIDPKEETASGVAPAAPTTTINPIGDDALPVSVPRMARSIILDPDGTVSWKMDRAISGAKVLEATATSAYGYKLNPAAVDKLNPGNPPRIPRNAGESAVDYNKRKAPLEEEFRKKSVLYRELRAQLQKLPDEFKGPAPATFWAIYETRSNPKTIEFDGAAPLPWEVSFELLLQLQRVFASGSAQETGTPLTGVTFSATSVEENITKALSGDKVHPYTVRLIVNAITMSSYLDKLEEGDTKYQVLEKVLASKDGVATADVMKYLAVRPSKASASLIKKAIAAGLLDPKAQLSSIKGMLDTIAANPNFSVDNAVLTINQYLADPKGPPAKESLTALLELARGKQNMSDQIAKAMRFDAAAGPRRDELIVAVVEAAAADPLAAALLDQRILGSEDATLVERALYLISRCVRPKMPLSFTDFAGRPVAVNAPGTRLVALTFWASTNEPSLAVAPELVRLHKKYGGNGVVFVGINHDKEKATLELALKEQGIAWPQVWDGKMMDSPLLREWAVHAIPQTILLAPTGEILWRGYPDRLGAAIDAQLAAKPAPAPSAADTDPRPRPVGDVLIAGVESNIFRLLVDAKLRNLAWAALPNMTMLPADRASKWASVIVDAAVSQAPTPVASVHFLAKHRDDTVPEALVQMVVRSDSNASKQACRYLLGSGMPIDAVLAKMPGDARHAFGMTFYENIVVEAPPSVGLLRDKADNAKVLPWFGRQVSLGQLPEPAKWVRPYGTPDRLVEMILVSDEQLAHGAIGTLVAGAGGSGAEVASIATKLRASKELPEAGKAWASLRKELFANKLKAASTSYALSVRLGEPIKGSKEDEVTWSLPQALGNVQMKVEGPAVTIGKAAAAIATDDSLTLALKGADLKLIDETAGSPLASVKVAADKVITVQPQGMNAWFAEFTLDDGRKVEIILEAKR